MGRRSGGRSMLRLVVLLLGVGSVAWAFLLDEEPAAFGRIRSFSAKVQRRAMEAAAAQLAEEQAKERTARLAALPDLLGRFGSWDGSEAVQHVFSVPAESPELPAATMPATPRGPLAVTADPGPNPADTLPEPEAEDMSTRQLDADLPAPAPHRVTLIMLGGELARAVVDNAVLTLGDRVGDGVLVQIHSHGVVLRGQQGLVAYDVGSDTPRRISDEELQATQANMGAGR